MLLLATYFITTVIKTIGHMRGTADPQIQIKWNAITLYQRDLKIYCDTQYVLRLSGLYDKSCNLKGKPQPASVIIPQNISSVYLWSPVFYGNSIHIVLFLCFRLAGDYLIIFMPGAFVSIWYELL